MATQTTTVTTSYVDITTALSLLNSTLYVFQNIGNENIQLVAKAAPAPSATTLGMVLYPGETYAFPNSTTDVFWAKVPKNTSVLAVINAT